MTTITHQDGLAELLHGVEFQSLEELQRRLRQMADWYRTDINRISETLNEEADQRDWCSDYDSFVERMNRSLHVAMHKRTQRYSITARFEVVVTQHVVARDEDAASHQASFEDWDSERIARALREGNADYTLDDVNVDEDDQ